MNALNPLLNKRFSPAGQSAFEARYEAQKIAFAPVVFQCVRYAWKAGVLDALAQYGESGCSIETLAETGRWSAYALKIVLESCLSAGVVMRVEGRYVLDKAGYCVLTDAITQANFNFVADVCYSGLADLDTSLETQRPVGLRALGDWPTVYEGLPELSEPAKSSWFAFDHLYSDTSFPMIFDDVMASAPRHIMDIGANTGKFSLAMLQHNAEVHMHLVDLPQQLTTARETLDQPGLIERAHFYPTNLLNATASLPDGMNLVWMSQFLSCFSEEVIEHILRRVARALQRGGQVLILDTFWDRQRYDIAAYCLINTSPYFTALASGNSKVYESCDYVRLAERAGLALTSIRDDIGYCHSLMRFSRQDEVV